MPLIDKIHIENYRSIERLDLKFHKINAFIGPNNAGKSNILRAISLVLGDTYPTARSFDDNDFYNRDRSKKIQIDVIFDSPIFDQRSSNDIHGFRLECQNDVVNFYGLDSAGNVATYSNGRTQVRINNELRDEVPLVFVDIDRQSSQQVRATQWTLYGKILRHLEGQMPVPNKEKFYQDVRSSFNNTIFNPVPGADLKFFEDELKTAMKSHTGFHLSLELSILDPLQTIRNVRPFIWDSTTSNKFDPEEMGAGTQSALAVSIASAYGKIVKKSVLLGIEEPEIHLHPQACRHFYEHLKNQSDANLQVIYTTHSKSFVDVFEPSSIHIVRKNNMVTEVASGLSGSTGTGQLTNKVVTKFNDEVNEALFADHAILVEGPDDQIACKAMFLKNQFDYNGKNTSIISCGGLSNIPDIASVLKSLRIDTKVLIDEDPGNPETLTHRIKLESILGPSSVFLQRPDLEGIFGRSNKFDQAYALKFFASYSGNIPKVYSDLISTL